MRRELIFDSGIAETHNQFHATIPTRPKRTCGDGRLARPPSEARPLAAGKELLLLLLLSLLRCSLGPFFLSLLLTLLDDFGLSRSSRRFRRRFRRDRNFFLHRGHVRDRLILISEELDLLQVRQIRNAQHLAERQVT